MPVPHDVLIFERLSDRCFVSLVTLREAEVTYRHDVREGHFAVAVYHEITPAYTFDHSPRCDKMTTALIGDVCKHSLSC